MSVLVIGADYLGSIKNNLNALGFKEIIHFTGRKQPPQKFLSIPSDAGLILVLTDYVNHSICAQIKSQAKVNNIPIIFAKRSWSHISEKFKKAQII